VLEVKTAGGKVRDLPGAEPWDAWEAVERVEADLVVDATSTDFAREGWGAHLESHVVSRGAPLVMAAKDAAAAHAHRWLDLSAARGRVGINAVLGGAGAALRHQIAELRAEATGVAIAGSGSTTTIIEVVEAGGSIQDGIDEAGRRGLLETDPELDLKGYDAAVKLAVVASALWGVTATPEEVPRQDIRDLEEEEIRGRAARGHTTRLVARGDAEGRLAVGFEGVSRTSPLAVPGDRAAYVYDLPGRRRRVHLGAGMGPAATAAGLFREILEFSGAAVEVAGRAAPAVSVELPASTETVHLPSDFVLECGVSVHPGHLAFERWGSPDRPTVVVMGGISATRFAGSVGDERGWWTDQVGPGRAIDTERYHVIAFDYLGGAGASWGPCTTNAWDPAWVAATVDQARALAGLLDALGVERVHAVVGASFGGMVALALAEAFPPRVGRLCVLGASHRSHPMATAAREIQRRIVRLGLDSGDPAPALSIARGLGMITYRSSLEFEERFPTPAEHAVAGVFPVAAYLKARGDAFAQRFDPQAFLCLSEALDRHAVHPESVRAPLTLVGFDTDALVPPAELERLAVESGGPAWYIEVQTEYGHDGFLKEHDAVGEVLVRCLAADLS
ncbi:MAG: alpha/beta fold hydrolase, partial [Gemmatimonadota bacterium]|nr:alpha/beta fold hydrolase [Gemmatimonadota bacterium]